MSECIQANSKKMGTVSIQVSTVFILYPAQYRYTHGTVRYCTCTGLSWIVPFLYQICTVYWMRVQKRYCSVPCFYSWYRAVPFLYQLFTVYQKPLPIRYCPVPCLYRLSGNRYRYTVLDGIGTMCKTVPFGTFPIPCTGNTVSEQYQFLPYNSTGTVPSSTVMFTGDIINYFVDVTSLRLPNRQPKQIHAKFTLKTVTTRLIRIRHRYLSTTSRCSGVL